MTLVESHRLKGMALEALEEAAARARSAPIERSRALAFALAYLAHESGAADRWFFDQYWRALIERPDKERSAYLTAALNGIYTAAGTRRETNVVSRFERAAHAELG